MSVWHAAYDEVLVVALLFSKRPSLNRGRCGIGSAAEPRGHVAGCGGTALHGGCECGSGSHHLMPFPINKIAGHQGSNAFRKPKKDFSQLLLGSSAWKIPVYDRKVPLSTFAEVLVLCST